MGHFLLPRSLWERLYSQILIPFFGLRGSPLFWKTAKSESSKVNHFRCGATVHEVRTANMPMMLPQGCAFAIWEWSISAFQQEWSSKLVYVFIYLFIYSQCMAPLAETKTEKKMLSFPLSLYLVLPPAYNSTEWRQWRE